MSWKTKISISNTLPSKFSCKVKKGQVFENKRIGTGFQNVAAIKDYIFDIPPNSKIDVEIEVYCINQHLKPPKGNLNVTKYMLNRNFTDQQDLWSFMNSK